MLFLTTAEEKLEHLTVFLGAESKVLSERRQWQLHSKTMSNPAVFFFKKIRYHKTISTKKMCKRHTSIQKDIQCDIL